MKKKDDAATMAAFPVSAFSYVAYCATYHSPHWSRGSATLPQRRALYRETRQRLEHGVPVGVLIRDVTMKLRALRAGEVRHV